MGGKYRWGNFFYGFKTGKVMALAVNAYHWAKLLVWWDACMWHFQICHRCVIKSCCCSINLRYRYKDKERQITNGWMIVTISLKKKKKKNLQKETGIIIFKLSCWSSWDLLRCQYASSVQYSSSGKWQLFRNIWASEPSQKSSLS